MAASTYFDQVQQLYIAYFGRPADPVGQTYWATQIDAANGSIASVIAGFSASAESVGLFGSATTMQKVTAIYQNAFGRAPEATGLAYWVALLDSGKISHAEASWTIQQAAGPGDASAVNNKLTAANAFTAQIDTAAEVAGYNGNAAAALARTYLSKADATYASIANVAVDSVTSVATATGTAVVTPVTPVSPVSPVVFTATKDASNVVTFANAGSTIEASPIGNGFTFTSNGAYAGSVTISSTVTGVEVLTGSTLEIFSLSAMGITFTGTGTIALTNRVSLAASTLNSIDALTTGALSTSIVGTVGSATDVKAALTSAGISRSPSIGVAVLDASASVADLNVIDGQTTGMVEANVSGTAANLDLLAPTSTNNAYTLTVTDSVPVAATVLTSLDAKTTVTVNASMVSTISGTSAEVASVAGAAGITKAAAFNSSLSGAFTASDINIIGAVSPAGSITYTGTNADQALNFSGVTHALTIIGGNGNDVITGGAGADILTGGTGIDKFIFAAGATGTTVATADTITDFVTTVDTITFGAAVAAANVTKGAAVVADFAAALAAANLVLTNDNNGVAQVDLQQVGSDTYAFYNDGALVGADQVIKLSGVALTGVDAVDFAVA